MPCTSTPGVCGHEDFPVLRIGDPNRARSESGSPSRSCRSGCRTDPRDDPRRSDASSRAREIRGSSRPARSPSGNGLRLYPCFRCPETDTACRGCGSVRSGITRPSRCTVARGAAAEHVAEQAVRALRHRILGGEEQRPVVGRPLHRSHALGGIGQRVRRCADPSRAACIGGNRWCRWCRPAGSNRR